MDELMLRLKRDEGLKLYPYLDTKNKLTIGIGRNLTDRGISAEEAYYLCQNDIDESKSELSHYDWFNNLDKVRQEVIIELHFNIGLPSLLGFKRMINCLEGKYYLNATKELLNSKWARSDVGAERSQDMAQRLKTGTYNGGKG